jgi:hypothetical protein
VVSFFSKPTKLDTPEETIHLTSEKLSF